MPGGKETSLCNSFYYRVSPVGVCLCWVIVYTHKYSISMTLPLLNTSVSHKCLDPEIIIGFTCFHNSLPEWINIHFFQVHLGEAIWVVIEIENWVLMLSSIRSHPGISMHCSQCFPLPSWEQTREHVMQCIYVFFFHNKYSTRTGSNGLVRVKCGLGRLTVFANKVSFHAKFLLCALLCTLWGHRWEINEGSQGRSS